jgi:hypothetical protein
MTNSTAAAKTPADIIATAPALSWVPNLHGKPSIRMEWELAVNADGSRELAVVHVHHWTTAKLYRAVLRRTKATPATGGGFAVETYDMLSRVVLDEQPTARYSRKAHLAFAAGVEARLAEGAFSVNPEVIEKFDVRIPA